MTKPVKLFNKNYFLIWQGQFVSRMGNSIFMFAMILWVTYTFDSTTLVGVLGMAGGLPLVLFSAFGGAFADRYSRRSIIIWCDMINGILLLALAAMFFIFPETSPIIIMALIVTSIFASIITAFFMPAIGAAIPDIVPKDKVAGANAMGQLSIQISEIFGKGAGAQILNILGAPLLTLINGITFIFSSVSEMFVTIPQEFPDKSQSFKETFTAFKSDISEGFKYILKNTGLKHMVFASLFMAFFSTPSQVLLPFFIKDYLKVIPDWFGWMLIAYGIGMAIGYGIVGIFKMNGRRRRDSIIALMILEALTVIFLGLSTNPFQALIVMFLGGLFAGFITANITTIIQLTTPSTIRGRVFGLLTTITGSIAPLGMAASGIIASLINQNIPLMFIGSGSIIVVLSILVSLSRDFRNFINFETEEEAKDDQSGFHYNIKPFEPVTDLSNMKEEIKKENV